jgi:ribosomal protein S18 acetylase RimI-like enzyme
MPPAVSVRPAALADAERLCELHLASVRTLCARHYAPEVIEGWLEDRVPQGYLRAIRSGATFVAQVDSRVIGFGESGPGEVLAVFVDPAYARRGVGSLLLAHALVLVLAQPGRTGPVKVESTLNAVGFYERAGFRVVGHATQRRDDVDVPVVAMSRA